MSTRIERDSMGEMEVPADALWGASTQRAVLNFEVSELRLPQSYISALGTIKLAAAEANMALGLLDIISYLNIAHQNLANSFYFWL